MRITPPVKEFIEKHITLVDDNNLEEFYACAREELDAYQIVELMLIMTESGVFDDKIKFDVWLNVNKVDKFSTISTKDVLFTW